MQKGIKFLVGSVIIVGGYIGYIIYDHNNAVQITTTFKQGNTKTYIWSSDNPNTIMSEHEAQMNINNIKALTRQGWYILIQDNKFISFNSKISGRNDIIEQAVGNLYNGSYALEIDENGKIIDITPSEEAQIAYKDKIAQVKDRERQKVEEQEKSEHDREYVIIQNNIDDIYKTTKEGYRLKRENGPVENIITWNIQDKDDRSPSLEYSLNRLADFEIFVVTSEEGRVTGFRFNQSDFYDDIFNLYDMTE